MKGYFHKGERNRGTFEVVRLISQKLLDGVHQLGLCQIGQSAIKSDGSIRDGGAGCWQLPEL